MQVPQEYVGKMGKCPKCQKTTLIAAGNNSGASPQVTSNSPVQQSSAPLPSTPGNNPLVGSQLPSNFPGQQNPPPLPGVPGNTSPPSPLQTAAPNSANPYQTPGQPTAPVQPIGPQWSTYKKPTKKRAEKKRSDGEGRFSSNIDFYTAQIKRRKKEVYERQTQKDGQGRLGTILIFFIGLCIVIGVAYPTVEYFARDMREHGQAVGDRAMAGLGDVNSVANGGNARSALQRGMDDRAADNELRSDVAKRKAEFESGAYSIGSEMKVTVIVVSVIILLVIGALIFIRKYNEPDSIDDL